MTVRILKRLAVLVAAVYGGLVGLVWVGQDDLVYFPSALGDVSPADEGLPFEDLWLEASDGVHVHGWFVPGMERAGGPAPGGDESRVPPGTTLLYAHGNGENVGSLRGMLARWHRLGLDAAVFDYRGYGRSEGEPGEAGTYLDAEAVWRHLVDERGVDPGRIILWGHSLGGGVVSELAERFEPGALVLASTFTSAVDVGLEAYPYLPVRLLARHRYPTLERLPNVRCPVVVAHGRPDTVIGFGHGERLYAGADEPKLFVELTHGHENGFHTEGAWQQILAFLRPYLGAADGLAAAGTAGGDAGRPG